MKRIKRLAVACGFALVVGTSVSAVPAGAQTDGDLSAFCEDSTSGSVVISLLANVDLTITSATVSIDGGPPQTLSFDPTTLAPGGSADALVSGVSGAMLSVTVNIGFVDIELRELRQQPSIQQDLPNPCSSVDITAEGECAPDGSTQGVVVTFINNSTAPVMGTVPAGEVVITSAGYVGPGSEGGSLSFSPSTVAPGGAATASLSISGQSGGAMTVIVEYDYNDAPEELTVEFEVTACTSAVPEAIQQVPSFTG